MKVLFLTITLGLITALQIIGTWYVKAVVADKDLPKEKRPKKVFPLTVTALDGGDLEAMVTFMKGGQCHEKRVVMHQTEEPGRYSAHGGKRHVYILDLPVKDHHIFYCEGQLGGKAIRMAKLVGKRLLPQVLRDLPLLLFLILGNMNTLLLSLGPWKNLRNSQSARDCHRTTSSCPSRRVRGQLCPGSLEPVEAPLPAGPCPGIPGPWNLYHLSTWC
uniref:Lipocalin/cytosolic fatty-acid binding domain-containing protein n=1 Tax=Equus asinus TaxID=9793 RepID=A0A8C4KTM1_EQUAS